MSRVDGRNIYIIKLAKVVRAVGSVDKFVQRCVDSHFSAIWIRLGYGKRLDPNLSQSAFAEIQQKLRAEGIQIWGWHLPRCPNLAAARLEASSVGKWARDFDLDGVLLDAEHGDDYFQGGEAEAEQYAGDVSRNLAALGKGLALSSHDQPRGFPDFPFAAFLNCVSDNCPQVYYKTDVATRLGKSIRDYKALEIGRDFKDRYKPVGNITVSGDVALPNAGVCLRKAGEFIDLVRHNAFKAYSFWCWDEAPDEIFAFFRDHPIVQQAPLGDVASDAARAAAIEEDEISEFAADMQVFRTLAEELRSEFYDSTLAPQVDEFATRIREGTDVASLSRWLQLQSMTVDLAVEGISDTTFKLWQLFKQDIDEAAARLGPEQRSRIEALLREFADEDDGAALPPQVARSRAMALRADAPASFIGESTFTSVRGFPVVQGTLTLRDSSGAAHNYLCNSGGGARNSHLRNGPTPPGVYRVSNHRPNRTTTGMVLDGVGYSFDVDPTEGTPVFGRSLFRIHPDGGHPQTNGCLGVREGHNRLREAERIIVDLMRASGSFKIKVVHDT
jgi:hypothetical protein